EIRRPVVVVSGADVGGQVDGDEDLARHQRGGPVGEVDLEIAGLDRPTPLGPAAEHQHRFVMDHVEEALGVDDGDVGVHGGVGAVQVEGVGKGLAIELGGGGQAV